ncbi:MAG: GNAT family N-acetyltransferase [Defluviitaleaceae bacterium]|nr:GNAT family N-acetyltransferase [Defluviitaleaceae bacterium]
MFQFLEFNDLKDNEIKLVLKSQDQPNYEKGILPRYGFSIIRISDGKDMGVVYFAVDTTRRQYLKGHLSYGIFPSYLGNNYATKACNLVKHVALAHGFKRLFIGSLHDNIASRKTIEKLGATPVTVDDVHDDKILQELQKEKTDMYVWDITVQ